MHHFDTFDGIRRDSAQIEIVMAENGVTGVHAFAVDQDQRIAGAKSLLLGPVSTGRFDDKERFIELRLLRFRISKLLRIKHPGEELHGQHVTGGMVPDAKTATGLNHFQRADVLRASSGFRLALTCSAVVCVPGAKPAASGSPAFGALAPPLTR